MMLLLQRCSLDVDRQELTNTPNLVPAVDRAFRILELLKSVGGEYTTVEIAKALNLNKSTVHKLVVTLRSFGVVQRDEQTKKYSLGIVLAEYGSVALANLDIRRAARPMLSEMVEFSGETAVLAVLRGTKVILVDKKEPNVQPRVSPVMGWRFPATLNCLGKAMLAWLPQDRVDEIMRREGLPRRTAKSITDPLTYEAELAATRERGFATEFEEFHDGVNGVAAPVLDSRRRVVGALGVGGPAFRVTSDRMEELGRRCVELANQISSRL